MKANMPFIRRSWKWALVAACTFFMTAGSTLPALSAASVGDLVRAGAMPGEEEDQLTEGLPSAGRSERRLRVKKARREPLLPVNSSLHVCIPATTCYFDPGQPRATCVRGTSINLALRL